MRQFKKYFEHGPQELHTMEHDISNKIFWKNKIFFLPTYPATYYDGNRKHKINFAWPKQAVIILGKNNGSFCHF